MSRRVSFVALLFGAALLLPHVADAAQLTKKGQKTPIVGDIQKITRTEVTIKPKTKDAEVVPVNEIQRLQFSDEPALLNSARTQEDKGSLGVALESYTKMLADPKSSAPDLKADIEYLIARTTARQALADPSKRDDAIKRLDAHRKAHGDSFRYFEACDFLGQVQLAKGDFAAAKEAYDALEQAPWSDYKMAAKIGNARIQFRQGQFGPALEGFNAVVAMPGTSESEVSRKNEALLGKASCLQQQAQYDDAIKALDEVIEKVSPEDKRVQAEAYLRQGDCLQQKNKNKEALFAYLHVDVLYRQETAAHAEALYNLAKLWKVLGQAGRGEDAQQELQKEYPNSEWAKKAPAATTATE